jgi:hypothetical protein
MLQQHALVCTVEGQQLHEAQVAQLIVAAMAEECLSGVVQEFDNWCYSSPASRLHEPLPRLHEPRLATSSSSKTSFSSLFACAGAATLWRPSRCERLNLDIAA